MNIVDVGQQQLTVTDVNGCSVTEVFIVEEQPSPIITQADFDYTLTTDSILLTNLSKGAIINTQWTTSTPELIVDNKVALPPPGLYEICLIVNDLCGQTFSSCKTLLVPVPEICPTNIVQK